MIWASRREVAELTSRLDSHTSSCDARYQKLLDSIDDMSGSLKRSVDDKHADNQASILEIKSQLTWGVRKLIGTLLVILGVILAGFARKEGWIG